MHARALRAGCLSGLPRCSVLVLLAAMRGGRMALPAWLAIGQSNCREVRELACLAGAHASVIPDTQRLVAMLGALALHGGVQRGIAFVVFPGLSDAVTLFGVLPLSFAVALALALRCGPRSGRVAAAHAGLNESSRTR